MSTNWEDSVSAGRATAVTHLSDSHGFDDLDSDFPADSVLDEIHADLHAQEIKHELATHGHRTALVEFASGEVVGVFDSDEEAIAYALLYFGEDAGKGVRASVGLGEG